MSKKTPLAAALVVAFAAAPFAAAQDVPWRVVLGSSTTITMPGLPAASRSFTDELIADTGAGRIGARLTGPDGSEGYWALNQGNWTQYTKLGVAGAALGPGRSGGEAAHVFLSVASGGSGAGADGQRAFIARAGLAGDTTSATWGVWRRNGSANVEVVRGLTDGALGPNLGANWVYQNDSSAFAARAMEGGRMLVNAYVTSPTGLSRLYLGKAGPGGAVVPCAMKNSTEATLAPGLAAGDSFDTTWTFSDLSLTPAGLVYGSLHTNQSRDGIWKLCEGAPQAIVVDDEPGARGPDIGVSTAIFTGFGAAHPGDGGDFAFFATYRESSAASTRTGLFRHDAGGNPALAMNDAAGVHGPGWADGATWSSFDTASLTTAGDWAAFRATMHTSDGGSPSGLWRVRAGASPELVALIGLTGDYGPEPNRTWDNFYGNAVLSNGDIVVEARTQPGSEYAIWLLKADGTKRRVLKVGQVVSVPTASGSVQGSVSSYDLPGGTAPYSRGGDYWIAADGSLLVDVNLVTYGHALITATPSNPVDLIFRNGFDG